MRFRCRPLAGKDPYAIADAIQKLAADDTKANADLAKKEWERVTPSYAQKTFSAVPSLSVTPAGRGGYTGAIFDARG